MPTGLSITITWKEKIYNSERKQLRLKSYHKIPNISPGLIVVRKHFLGDLYSGGLYLGAYIRGVLCSGLYSILQDV